MRPRASPAAEYKPHGRKQSAASRLAAAPVVYIVDDDPAVLGAAARLLKYAGFNTCACASAEAFFDAYEPDRKGCLVLDVKMPGMSGLDLLSELTARRVRLPVILLTAYADVQMAVRAFKAGAVDLIEKPFNSDTLLARIRSVLARAQTPSDEDQLAQRVLSSMGDAVFTTDAAGRVDYINPAAEKLTGWPLAEARGRYLPEVLMLIDETTRRTVEDPLASHSDEEDARLLLVRRDGDVVAVHESTAPIYSRAGDIVGAVIVFRDATRLRVLTDYLAYQASHDHLTGLVNRREFEQRLTRALKRSRERGEEYAVCYLDLDRFKQVNDAAGHAAGDELLRRIAVLIRQNLRQRDTPARLGGDEFAVLLEHCSLVEAASIARKLCQALRDFRFVWEDRTFTVGASVGVAAVTAQSDSVMSVLLAADAACYAAKRQGRDRVCLAREDAAAD